MKRISVLMILVGLVFSVNTLSAQVTRAPGDTLELSLNQAMELASTASEEVQLARAGVTMAAAQVREAWSTVLPQISGNIGYTRTLASAFDTGGGGFTLPDSLQFNPDPNASIDERLRYLEQRTPIAGLGSLGQLFGDLPFGQENAYTFSISGSQLLFSGGRTGAAISIAQHFEEAARLSLTEQVATIELDIRSAYYQALLSGELVAISEAAIEQAERFLEQERLRLKAGRSSDLEVLRAEVELENLRPQLVQARNAADLASLNLKRLVNIPLDQPVRLTSRLVPPAPEEREDVRLAPQTLASQRASLQAAEEQVAIREQQVRIARADFWPSISLSTNYGKLIYPPSLFSFGDDWRTDWAVSLSVQVPIFNGFRRSAQVQQARVDLLQSRLQRDQLQEAIQVQYEQAIGEKRRALAEIEARQRTIEQAERVYQLTEMRYQRGLATQLDVFSTRLALYQARTNYAQALTSYYVADAGLDRAIGISTIPTMTSGINTGTPAGQDQGNTNTPDTGAPENQNPTTPGQGTQGQQPVPARP